VATPSSRRWGIRELVARRDYIPRAITDEEERRIARRPGIGALDSVLARSKTDRAGAEAFKLYDTFGLPLEITRDVAKSVVFVDEAGFQESLAQQREAPSVRKVRDGRPTLAAIGCAASGRTRAA
jgi:alanyl-tRNA synthetase